MNNHIDENFEKLIGKRAKVEWFDGMIKEGILSHNLDGRNLPYSLITETNVWVFYKSHIKHIEQVKGSD